MERQPKIGHRRAQALLGDYAAGEITSTERQALTRHLQVCTICQKDLAEIEQIRTRLRSFALPDGTSTYTSLFDKGGAAFGGGELELRAPKPGQMVRASNTRSVRRPVTILVATLLAVCLLVSTVAIFATATYRNNGPARPHPISVPAAPSHPKQPSPTNSPTSLPTASSQQRTPVLTPGVEQNCKVVTPTPHLSSCSLPTTTP